MTRLPAAAVILLAVLAGCGPAAPPIDEYGPAIEERAAAYRMEHDELGRRHLADLDAAITELARTTEGEVFAAAALDETAQRFSAMFAGIADALHRHVESLRNMEAPAVVAEEHEAYVKALEAAGQGLGPLIGTFAELTSLQEIERAMGSSGYADAGLRVTAACNRLEQALEANGITVNLRCEEGQ